jgi:hypothetical protein
MNTCADIGADKITACSPYPALQKTQEPSGATAAATSEPTAERWERPQPDRREMKKRHSSPTAQSSTWLMAEPGAWIGRRIRSRKNSAVYTVAQIFKNGRVQLEKNWMTYLSDVETIRKEYETHN